MERRSILKSLFAIPLVPFAAAMAVFGKTPEPEMILGQSGTAFISPRELGPYEMLPEADSPYTGGLRVSVDRRLSWEEVEHRQVFDPR